MSLQHDMDYKTEAKTRFLHRTGDTCLELKLHELKVMHNASYIKQTAWLDEQDEAFKIPPRQLSKLILDH